MARGKKGSGIQAAGPTGPEQDPLAADPIAVTQTLANDYGTMPVAGGEKVVSKRDKALGGIYECIVVNLFKPQEVTTEFVLISSGDFGEYSAKFKTNTVIELPLAVIRDLDGDSTRVENERVIHSGSGLYEAGSRLAEKLAELNPSEQPKVNSIGQIVLTSGYKRFMVQIRRRIS